MNYYKITNETETHHDLQYHDGLNIDPVTFNPSGDCKPGGIYYSKEDILAFVDYGCWIRKVEIPDDAGTYLNPGSPVKWKSDKVFLHPRKQLWNVETFQELLKEGADPKAENSYALRYASYNGHLDIVKLLIPLSDPLHMNSQSLINAALMGHYDIVKLLLQAGSNPLAENSMALQFAAKEGHADIVKLLIPLSDPKAYDSYALRYASYYGHLDIVKLFIPVSDPKARNSEALRWASYNGHLDIVKLLIPVSDPEVVKNLNKRE